MDKNLAVNGLDETKDVVTQAVGRHLTDSEESIVTIAYLSGAFRVINQFGYNETVLENVEIQFQALASDVSESDHAKEN